jgi:CrcB protein
MSLAVIMAVAGGGALGSAVRYVVAVQAARLLGLTFPWGTLIVNVTGSFLIGAFAESFALRWDTSQSLSGIMSFSGKAFVA